MVPGPAKVLLRALHRIFSQRTGLRTKGHLILRESKSHWLLHLLLCNDRRRPPMVPENPRWWFACHHLWGMAVFLAAVALPGEHCC